MSEDKPMFGRPYKPSETVLMQALVGVGSFIVIALLAVFVEGGPALSFGTRLAVALCWGVSNAIAALPIWIGRHG